MKCQDLKNSKKNSENDDIYFQNSWQREKNVKPKDYFLWCDKLQQKKSRRNMYKVWAKMNKLSGKPRENEEQKTIL